MNIVCARDDLIKAVNIVIKAVPSKTTMTILENILIDATDGMIRMTATDSELGIETIVHGEIRERGMIALNAKMLSEMIRKFPDADVEIVTEENYGTTVKCAKALFNIPGQDGEEFTQLPVVERNAPIVISQFRLRELIRQTIFSTAQNDSNRIMTGELFEIKDGLMRVISLDGHRISIRKTFLSDESISGKVIVPGKTLNELSRILSGNEEDMVSIYMTNNHILFEMEETIVVSRLIEGNYFRVDQMISREFETSVTVNRQELADCIDRSLLMVREDDKKPIVLNIKDDNMDLFIRSNLGFMEENILVSRTGKDIRIGFNPKFIIDALRVIDDEEISIYFVNSKAPCVIKDEQENYLYLILPVNFVN